MKINGFFTFACMNKCLIIALFLNILAQSQNYKITAIDSILKVGAESVVRKKTEVFTVNSVDNINVASVYAVTIFSKKGEDHIKLGMGYDPGKKINKLYAVVYDKYGKEVKKIKQSKFEDFSSAEGYTTLAVDDRYKYYNYQNSNYPYTIEFVTEYTTTYSSFLNGFYFQSNYNQSVEQSEFIFLNPTNIPLHKKTYNFQKHKINVLEDSNKRQHYIAHKIPAVKKEIYAPNRKAFPHILVALEKFNLYELQGEVENWEQMGMWQYENLLKDRGMLPQETLDEISTLTSAAQSNLEKAKIIYNYVQNKTRYVSIQLGVGGWKPILASEVDKLGYGDCKALTNYTKSLLDSQNIPAYYTIVYAGNEIRDYNEDLVSMQGNHVILNLPQDDQNDIWLECTSQSNPFGYISGFTDNRKVLVITPEGGKIKKTKKYSAEENIIETNVIVTVNGNNSVKGNFNRQSSGSAYGWKSGVVNTSDKPEYYQKNFSHLNNMSIYNPVFQDDKEIIKLTESFDFKISSYGSKAGKKTIIEPILFDKSTYKKLATNRTQPIVVSRGYTCKDTYLINLEDSLTIYAVPENEQITSKFGSYSLTFEQISDQKIKILRNLKINDGTYASSEVDAYNEFFKSIGNLNKTKIISTK